jgi:hypothetical protein
VTNREEDMTLAEVRKYRGIHYAKRGMRVQSLHSGRFGRIAGGNSSGNLNIIFDGDNYSQNCHPNWQMVYFDNDGNVIATFGE